MEDLRYIYSVARVKVLETRLLKKEIFLQMLQAPTLDIALRILAQSPHYTLDITIKDAKDLEVFINQERQKLERFADELFVEPDLFEAYFSLRKDVLKSYSLILKTKSLLLKDFIKKFIDLYNIKTFLRMSFQKQSLEVLKINLIEGGYIAKIEFINRFEKSGIEFYPEVIKDGMMRIEKEGDFSLLERQIEDYLFYLMQSAKYMFFGPEPVFGYCLAKENELRTLKLIFLAKINSIPQAQIQERFLQTYA